MTVVAIEKSESAFEEGVEAFGRGKSRDACPYPAEDDRRRLWLEGWDKAKRADDLYVDGPP
ncbi:ribosome modulation factor [Methylocystis parvus]|uniref:ribosome modulation factor n=1 Tax=Methylocystis parvus TaxID=134 RepID=UPI003C70EEAF